MGKRVGMFSRWRTRLAGAALLLVLAGAIPLKRSELLSTEQCSLVLSKVESLTLGFLFGKDRSEVCRNRDGSDGSWQRKLLKAAQPPYLEFHNEVRPSRMNLEMEHLAKTNRSAMLSSMGTGDDRSKCFILGFSGYGNRGMWSAGVAKGLASQFFDNNVPLRWDVVAGISSGGFNAMLSSHFAPGGSRRARDSPEDLSGWAGATAEGDRGGASPENEFVFNDTSSREDSLICSKGGKEIKVEFWLNLGEKSKKGVKCYSNRSEVRVGEIYQAGDRAGIENELSFTSYLYEIYMRANPGVINDNCVVPTSHDSTRWWSTILHTFTSIGKKSTASFCTMRGWRKFYRDSMLKLVNRRREALVSATRIFDGTLIHWSLQHVASQIRGGQVRDGASTAAGEEESDWVEISGEDASKLADIAAASNSVSGVYMPIKVNNEYFVWGGLRGEANLEAAVERCKEIKPGIREEDIVVDFVTGAYYREEVFLAGSYVELLGKEHYFGKIFRRIKNLIHKTDAYARPDPPQLFELFNRAWEFVTASSRGMFPIKALKRRYPKVKIRFIVRPKTLRFFPRSSYLFPEHRDKILIMADGYYTGYDAVILDSDSIETNSAV